MTEPRPLLLPQVNLRGGLVQDLRRMNPWWEGKAMPVLPPTRRHLVDQIHRRLEVRLAPAVVVRGPRQIGKTTAQLQVLEKLLDRGVPPRNIFRVQADELPEMTDVSEPILRLVDWYETAVLGATLNEVAHRGEPTYLFFDEVQNLKDWAPQIKSLVDASTTQLLITGSSALRIELGRDSLAGRITTIEAGVLSLTEIGGFRGLDLGLPFLADNGLEPLTRLDFWQELRAHGRELGPARDQVFAWFSERGGYPLVHQRADVDWARLADQLNETVIRRVIQHDLRLPIRQHPEVDFVLTIGTKRIPLEVKYQRTIDPLRDTESLRTFIEKSVNNAPFGLLVTQTDSETVVDPRIVALPLSSLMLLR